MAQVTWDEGHMSNGALGDCVSRGISWAVQEYEAIMIYQFKRFL